MNLNKMFQSEERVGVNKVKSQEFGERSKNMWVDIVLE